MNWFLVVLTRARAALYDYSSKPSLAAALWGRLAACGPIADGPLRVFSQLLNELSDQNAYQRYLKMNGVTHSPAEWRRFIDARYRRKYHHAKCC